MTVPAVDNCRTAVQTTLGIQAVDLDPDLKHGVAWMLHLYGASYAEIAKVLGYYDSSGARKAAIAGRKAGAAAATLDAIEAQMLSLR